MNAMKRLVVIAAVVILGMSLAPMAKADQSSAVPLYSTPGVHLVNGRYWKTECQMYSSTVVRCWVEIFGTKVSHDKGRWYTQNTWVFNNLTYLPAPRAQWERNPLGHAGEWTADDGRQWRSECDTPATGTGACRNYAKAKVGSLVGGRVVESEQFVFNSMVNFSTRTLAPVSSIPAAAPARSDVPTPGPATWIRAGAVAAPPPAPVAPSRPRSVAPSGTNCPSSHPIKGNHSSSGEYIYHVRGGQFYDRTNPEECFATESDARAAGYRKSQR